MYYGNDDETQKEKQEARAKRGTLDYHRRSTGGTPRASQAQTQEENQALKTALFFRNAKTFQSVLQQVPSPEYYWVGVIAPFTEWLREAYGDSWITADQAHEMLKERILGEGTPGDVGMLRPSTTTLNTEEFAEYVDKAAAWLAEFCSITVIPADLFLLKNSNINKTG